jgi:hypothetical protein
MIMKKNPWLAVLLNVVVTGAGYLYLGKRTTFGVLLIISEFLAYVWMFSDPAAKPLFSNNGIMIVGITFLAAFAVDTYQEAVRP